MLNYVREETINKLLEEAEYDVRTVFRNTTVVTIKLKNGFTMTEASGCIDPKMYSMEIGAEICFEKIKDKLWLVEGYKLQDKLYKEREKEC